jgi:hypothetical protein
VAMTASMSTSPDTQERLSRSQPQSMASCSNEVASHSGTKIDIGVTVTASMSTSPDTQERLSRSQPQSMASCKQHELMNQ